MANVWKYTEIFDFHNRVRGLLNTNTITDEQMNVYEKAPLAEKRIKYLVSHWEDIKEKSENPPVDETDTTDYTELFSIFETCIIYQTAIFFEKFVQERMVKSRKTSAITVEYSTSGNIKENYTTPDLKQMLDMLLDQLNSLEDTGTRFYGFRVT